MRGGFYYLSDYVSRVLNAFSDNYPNKVVNPRMISCFVLQQKEGRKFFFPVQSVSMVKKSNGRSGDLCRWAALNVDSYSFCQNPIGVRSTITAADILDFENEVGKIDYYTWCCPQLDKDVCTLYNDASESELCSLLGEGIMIFRVV